MSGSKVLKALLGIVAAVFIVHQIYSSVYKPIVTESAIYYEADDGLNITGVIIRSEILISSDTDGVFHFVVPEGTRVAKNGTIANIYDSESASIIVSEIDSISAQIANIEDIQGNNNIEASDLELINGKVKSSLNALIFDCSAGNFNNAAVYSEALLSNINRRQIATGVVTDFSAQLAELNSRLNTLKASLPAAKGKILSPESGYFVSKVDGFEKFFDYAHPEKITPEILKSAKVADTDQKSIGKIVSDYEWYIAAVVSLNDSLKHKEGDAVKLRTNVKSNPVLSARVKHINLSEDSSEAVIIFSCNQLDSSLASMRSGPMTVISSSYKGLKVNKNALRVVDSKTGVYVLSGMQIRFVPVNVIYRTDSYIICEQQASTDRVLRLYDEVVVKGRNLYDGKIIS